jgi:hypothetical protein
MKASILAFRIRHVVTGYNLPNRMRAERRIGELMQQQRETVGLAKGGQPYQRSTGSDVDPVAPPTLAEAGIDKHMADLLVLLRQLDSEQLDIVRVAALAIRNSGLRLSRDGGAR